MMYSFSFTRFLSQRVFPSKVLTRHILLSMDTQGGVLWINGRPLIYTITHMIDNHIIHYSLWCNILYLLFDFISFLGYHIVPIEVAPYSLILYSSSPLSLLLPLFYNTTFFFSFVRQANATVYFASFTTIWHQISFDKLACDQNITWI